jgi:hypothetical protein
MLKRQTSRFHYGSKVPAVTITVFITILKKIGKIVVATIPHIFQTKFKKYIFRYQDLVEMYSVSAETM